MRICVQLFAVARDLAGASSAQIDLPPGSRVADLRRRLAAERPELRTLLQRCAVAVDEEFAGEDAVLAAEQRIALLPPVSGGQ